MMTGFHRHPTVGLPRRQAGWIGVAWFVLGFSAILAVLAPLRRDLRHTAELEMLFWLKAEADALRPLVEQAEQQRRGAVVQLPARREARPKLAVRSRYADQAQLWLVSAMEREPGLIVPVSTDFVAPESLRDFSLLQEGIEAARGSATRPLAFIGGPDGPQVVAYLRLVGTGYGISTSMRADLLYGRVTPWLVAVAAVATTLLACACAGLFGLIAAPFDQGPSAAAVAAHASAPPAPSAPTPVADTVPRLEASLQRILYHTDTLEHEGQADPRLREHLAEIRETARQSLADLRPKRD
jgi:hypothetical protein